MSSPIMYFEETFKKERKFRFCLRFVKSHGDASSKLSSDLLLTVNTETKKLCLLESEKRSVRDHLDFVIRKLERLHKSLIWSMSLGQVPIFVSDGGLSPGGETNITALPDKLVVRNPRTWSKVTLETMDSGLKQMEFEADGIVSVFATEEEEKVRDVGIEEVRKTGLAHLKKEYGPAVCREKVGRRHTESKVSVGGVVVFLAYKLISSVTASQILYETLVLGVDLASKKTELCRHLETIGLTPYTEERLRRQVDLLPPGLSREQSRLYQCLVRGWQGQEKIKVTLVNCQRKVSTVAKRECLCYSRD